MVVGQQGGAEEGRNFIILALIKSICLTKKTKTSAALINFVVSFVSDLMETKWKQKTGETTTKNMNENEKSFQMSS